MSASWERLVPPKGSDEWVDRSRAVPKKGSREAYEEVINMVQGALDRHAHELAEKIRVEADGMDGWPETQHAMRKAADLIDPEVD